MAVELESSGRREDPPAARANPNPVGGPPAYMAELLGTLLLVLFVVFVVSLTANPPAGLGYKDFAVIGMVHWLVLAVLITSLGGVSGAHFNPAVTIALLVKKKIGGGDAGIYIVCQLIGAVLGVLLAKVVMPDAAKSVEYASVGISEIAKGDLVRGMVGEFVGTFVLMWAIMATAVNPRGNRNAAPWVIGGALALGVMTLAPVTGAGFNPARAFGPALFGDFGDAADFLLAFVLAPILGALVAAGAYTAIVLNPERRGETRPVDKLD